MTATSVRRAPRDRSARSAEPVLGPPVLGPEQRRALLALVRAALAAASGRCPPSFLGETLDATVGLDEPARAFVTLTEDGRLRGCMGSLDPERSVRDSVVSAALLVAFEDPRFEPVAADELPAIDVAVSVLGPSGPFRSLDAFRPGVDGVIVERGRQGALLLPEVATEFGWGAVEMLDAVCRKAGLPRGAWADRVTRVSTFETVRFEGRAIEEPEPAAAEPR
jgi:AmmeMemoRadiSam system protein A